MGQDRSSLRQHPSLLQCLWWMCGHISVNSHSPSADQNVRHRNSCDRQPAAEPPRPRRSALCVSNSAIERKAIANNVGSVVETQSRPASVD
eukprot:42312-Eustigmatos_ZCMA.PRE.1